MTNFEIARAFAGIRGADLARALGVTPQNLYNWERGIRTPSRANAEAIARVLDVDPAWLLGVEQTLPVTIHGDTCAARVMRSEYMPGYGALYHVCLPDTDDIMPVLLAGGAQYTLADRDAADIPHTAADINAYKWAKSQGETLPCRE